MSIIHADLQTICPVNARAVQPSTSTSTAHYASSKTNEWYTPIRYIVPVREVLYGRIELDPASCAEANKIIRAERYYTITDDGLTQPWTSTNLFLNPPYGRVGNKSRAGIWAQRLINEYKAGNVEQAILLVNACTSEEWFQPLYEYPICFSNHRISFCGQKGTENSPSKGNAFVYFGRNIERFTRVFTHHDIGCVLIRYMAGESPSQ